MDSEDDLKRAISHSVRPGTSERGFAADEANLHCASQNARRLSAWPVPGLPRGDDNPGSRSLANFVKERSSGQQQPSANQNGSTLETDNRVYAEAQSSVFTPG